MQLLCNRQSGNLMVARNHYNSYARFVATLLCADNFLSGRVYHASYADKSHAVLNIRAFVFGQICMAFYGKSQDSKSIVGHFIAQRKYFCTVGVSHFTYTVGCGKTRTQWQHLLYGAFCVSYVAVIHFVYGSHALTVRVERLFKKAGVDLLEVIVIDAKLIGEQYKRALGGVADSFSGTIGVHVCVSAQRAGV